MFVISRRCSTSVSMPRIGRKKIRSNYPVNNFNANTLVQQRQLINFPDLVSTSICLICCVLVGRLLANKVNRTTKGAYSLLNKLVLKAKHVDNKRVRKSKQAFQRFAATRFYRQYELILGRANHSLLENLQLFFKKRYQIVVFSNKAGDNIVFRGPSCKRQIYLLESEKKGYYKTLKSPRLYFGYRKFCSTCLRNVKGATDHFCGFPCLQCSSDKCSTNDELRSITCSTCLRYFKNPKCFHIHKATGICDKIHFCQRCKRDFTVRTDRPHWCNAWKFCNNCFTRHAQGDCYVRKRIKNVDINDSYKTLYFDIETIQLEGGELKPVLLIASFKNEMDRIETHTFEIKFGNVVDQFIEFLLQHRTDKMGIKMYKFDRFICMAHNLKGFDGIFVLNSLLKYDTPSIIYSGSKINLISLSIVEIKFLDSFNFVAAPLRNLSKMFGLTETKSFFPYRLLREETLNYCGNLPPKEDYEPDLMKNDAERKEFETFYVQMQTEYVNKSFNLMSVMKEYCRLDVRVLLLAMESFRFLVASKIGSDPFENNVTLASICISDFISNHMLSKSIGIVPPRGYLTRYNQSAKAIDYLRFISFAENTYVEHAKTPEGEFQIGEFFLDGISHEKKKVWDFHGCYYHGCPKCFNHIDYNAFHKENMQWRYQTTLKRERKLRALMAIHLSDYTYHVVWEHEFDLLKKQSIYLNFVKQNIVFDDYLPITDRGFFYGGRTNAISFYQKADANIRIKYVDICSLYPFVNKYRKYPRGHPEIIRNNFDVSLNAYFGIISCKILPPSDLFHPILPIKLNLKLIFSLCFRCAVLERGDVCCHNEDERCLKGEWGTPEVYLAIENGYVLKEIYSVLHYSNSFEYEDAEQPGLFGGYINKWLQTKIEASGFPNNVQSNEEKQNYIREYLEKEDINLDVNNIRRNEGMRSLGKLFCNSLWGRFGLNKDKIQSIFFDSKQATEFHDLMDDDSNDVSFWETINVDKILVCFRKRDEYRDANNRGNVIIASFVSMWGRMELYKELSKLQQRVLYMDTDSLIYVVKEGEYEPTLGTMLGEYTDEIKANFGADYYIHEYVSTGPKSYGLKIKRQGDINGEYTQDVIKIKGATQNLLNKESLSFLSLHNRVEQMLRDQQCSGIVINRPINFVRNKIMSKIINKPTVKTLSLRYNKRVRKQGMYITYPYGYKL